MFISGGGKIELGQAPQKTGARTIRLSDLVVGTALGFLILLIFAFPIPYGSNRLWALGLVEIAVFLLAGLVLTCWLLGLLRVQQSLTRLVVCMLVWAGWLAWIAFQLQPLALEDLSQWSAHRAGLVTVLLESGYGSAREQFPITIDRAETYDHFIESITYAILFFSVILMASGSRRRVRIILWTVMLSALGQASYGSLMLMSGLEWGFWGRKEFYLGSATGTFVNRNHFAGYLELGIAAGIGIILTRGADPKTALSIKERLVRFIRRWDTSALFSRVAVALMFVGLILSQSRMGNAAALGGLSIAGLLFLLLRFGRGGRRGIALFVSVLVLDIWLVGGWFGLDELVERYEKTELTENHRASMWPDLKDMMVAYAPSGSGLGTFKYAYPEFHSEKVPGLNTHAHNDYAQFIIEVGTIGSAILASFVLLTLLQALRIIRNRRDPVYSGAAFAGLMAMLSIAIHSATDFNLQIPANAATLVVLMAVVWSCNPTPSRKRENPDRSIDANVA